MEGLYYPYSQNKGTDQLRCYREADLRLCFRICKKPFSHDEAQMVLVNWLATETIQLSMDSVDSRVLHVRYMTDSVDNIGRTNGIFYQNIHTGFCM